MFSPFYLTSFSYLVCLVLVACFFKEPIYNTNIVKQSILLSLGKILSNKDILLFLILFILLSSSIASVEVFFLTYVLADKLKLSPTMLGFIWTYLSFVATFLQMFLYRFIKPYFAVTLGFLLCGFAIFMISWVNTLSFAFFIATLMGIGIGLLFPNISSYLALNGSDKQQGSIFGITFAAESLGGAIGPFSLGYILLITGSLNLIWLILAFLCLIATIVASIYYYTQRKSLT